MPAKSARQQRFAAMSASKEGRKALRASGKEPMPAKTAHEFRHKPKGGYRK